MQLCVCRFAAFCLQRCVLSLPCALGVLLNLCTIAVSEVAAWQLNFSFAVQLCICRFAALCLQLCTALRLCFAFSALHLQLCVCSFGYPLQLHFSFDVCVCNPRSFCSLCFNLQALYCLKTCNCLTQPQAHGQVRREQPEALGCRIRVWHAQHNGTAAAVALGSWAA